MFASLALALSSSATSVFRHKPVIPDLGIFPFRLLCTILCGFGFLNRSKKLFVMVSSSSSEGKPFF